MKSKKYVAVIFFLMISISSLLSGTVLAQTNNEAMANSYSKKLTGTWLHQNAITQNRGSVDTTFYTYDTLMLSTDHTYYLSRGSNLEKHWSPMVSSGTWELNSKPVLYIQFKETFNNRALSVSDFVFTINDLTETEFNFLADDRPYVYKRMK